MIRFAKIRLSENKTKKILSFFVEREYLRPILGQRYNILLERRDVLRILTQYFVITLKNI
jgi:hypothetical protein